MSIRFRLTVWYTAILSVTLLVFGIVTYVLLSTLTTNQNKNILQEHTEKVERRIEFGLSLSMQGWDLDIQLDDIDTFFSKEIYLQVVNLTNITELSEMKISRSSNAEKDMLHIPFSQDTWEQAKLGVAFFETTKLHGYPFLVFNKPLMIRGQPVGVLQATLMTGDFLNHLQYIFIFASIITVLLASSLGWVLARTALKPIDYVIEATEQIEKAADLQNRIIYDGPDDEIGRLIDKMNGMLSRIQVTYFELEKGYRKQRQFVSDASHELRTPLTTIRGNVDLIQKIWNRQCTESAISDEEQEKMSLEAIKDISDESERMSRLVNHLLSLARADAGYEMTKEKIEIKPLVEEVIRKSQFIPRQVNWRKGDTGSLNGVCVMGNKDYLQQMLFIFIENAFKYTHEGYVQLNAFILSDQIGIQILDTGVGMDKDEIPYIFDRFYRADISRGKTSGTGLGLSIAKWIIDEHHGSVEVNTFKNEGSSFVVWLPICSTEASSMV